MTKLIDSRVLVSCQAHPENVRVFAIFVIMKLSSSIPWDKRKQTRATIFRHLKLKNVLIAEHKQCVHYHVIFIACIAEQNISPFRALNKITHSGIPDSSLRKLALKHFSENTSPDIRLLFQIICEFAAM